MQQQRAGCWSGRFLAMVGLVCVAMFVRGEVAARDDAEPVASIDRISTSAARAAAERLLQSVKLPVTTDAPQAFCYSVTSNHTRVGWAVATLESIAASDASDAAPTMQYREMFRFESGTVSDSTWTFDADGTPIERRWEQLGSTVTCSFDASGVASTVTDTTGATRTWRNEGPFCALPPFLLLQSIDLKAGRYIFQRFDAVTRSGVVTTDMRVRPLGDNWWVSFHEDDQLPMVFVVRPDGIVTESLEAPGAFRLRLGKPSQLDAVRAFVTGVERPAQPAPSPAGS